jgi:hypothetical protein
MHASIRRYTVASERRHEIIDIGVNPVLPLMQREEGFLAYYFVEVADGEYVGISLFSSMDGARKANAIAAAYIAAHEPGLFNLEMEFEGRVVGHAGHTT